jgi:hypothetical protein
VSWRADKPAELAWIEAKDGGDPDVQVSPRDVVYVQPAADAAAGKTPHELAGTDMRCGGVAWGDGGAWRAGGRGELVIASPVKTLPTPTTTNTTNNPPPQKKPTTDLALLYESRWSDRRSRVWTIAPNDPSRAPAVLFDRS